MKSIVGKKVGMTQIFNEDGVMIPVTVIEAGPVVVTQIKKRRNGWLQCSSSRFWRSKRKTREQTYERTLCKSRCSIEKIR